MKRLLAVLSVCFALLPSLARAQSPVVDAGSIRGMQGAAVLGPRIVFYNGDPEGALTLANGSFVIRSDTGRWYIKTGTGNTGWKRLSICTTASDTRVLFADAGECGADSSFTYDKSTGTLSATNFSGALGSSVQDNITRLGTIASVASAIGVPFGGTGLASGTSGGVPYYSGSTTLASSAALTANLPVIGGGAGVAPSVGTRSGNTTAFTTLSGAATSGMCAQFDSSGNLVATAAACGTGGGGTGGGGPGLLNVQIITATGAGTYTPTAGTSSIVIAMVGGGGGGSGVAQASGSQVNIGGGGSGGAYLSKRLTSAFSGAAYVVGAKGTGGTAGNNNGSDGADTTFTATGGGGTVYTAGKGTGGTFRGSFAPPITNNSVAGGVATNGDVNVPGGPSLIGSAISGTVINNSGAGGNSAFGVGAVAVSASSTGTAGVDASGKGAGGSGAISSNNAGGTKAGGNGSDGVLIIWEYGGSGGGGPHGAPVIASGFGSGPTVTGDDTAFKVTVGSTPLGSGVLTFGSSWVSLAPACTANNETTGNLLRATTTTTQLTLTGTMVGSDVLSVVCADQRGTAASPVPTSVFNARLTTETGVPISTSDRTAQSTIYLTPYNGNQISLYTGSSWVTYTLTGDLSLALSGLTSGKPYDVFLNYNSGSPVIETVVWTNDTTRATALVTQDGVYVENGATSKRYVGTIYTTGTTTTEDSALNRYVWNCYNQVIRPMTMIPATTSWTYNSQTIRQWNATSTNQVAFVSGLPGGILAATLTAGVTGAFNQDGVIGLGLDSTTAFATGSITGFIQGQSTGAQLNARYSGSLVTAGRHYMAALEAQGTVSNSNITLAGTSGRNVNGMTASFPN